MSLIQCPNGLNKTYLVSFPRSGHHLLVRGIDEALNHRLVYSEFYKCKHNFETCEFVNLQKSHDFNLEDPILETHCYIVMIRDMIYALESWYSTLTEPELSFKEFCQTKESYFDGFLAKWVQSEIPNRIIIPYHDLVDKKIQYVQKACELMGAQADESKLKTWELRERVKASIKVNTEIF